MNADFRLSPQQRSQWLSRAEWDHARRFQCLIALNGTLDRASLERALTRVIERHETLRTTFHVLPGMSLPVQRVRAPEPTLLAFVDISACAPDDRACQLVALLREQRGRGFALDGGPSIHLSLVELAAQEHALLVTLPALTADSRSLDVFVDDLARCYVGEKGGPAAAIPSVQYPDVAEVFNHLLESEDTEGGRRFWQAQNLGERDGWKLPLEGARADAEPFATAAVPWEIDGVVAADLEQLATRCGAPLPIILLACWQVLLSRLTGAPALRVGVLYSGRTYEGLEDAIGAFERYLPLSCSAEETLSFVEFATRLVLCAKELAEWQDYFDPKWTSDAGKTTNLPFAFSFEERSRAVEACGLSFSVDRKVGSSTRCALELGCESRAGAIHAELSYDPLLHSEAEVRRIGDRLTALVRSAANAPETPLGQLSTLGAGDLRFFAQHAAPTRDYPRDRTIHSLFEEQSRRTPDAVALVCGDHQLTFRELNERANQLAHYLRTIDVGPDVCVGLCLDRSLDLIVGLLGILKAGGAYVPLDPAHPKERLGFILEQARIRTVLTQRDLYETLPEGAARRICLDAAPEEIERAPRTDLPSAGSATSLAYVIYTSGSTGKPKGVMVEHRSVVHLGVALEDAVYRDRGAGLVVTLNAPISFDASVKQWIQLLRGRTLCVVPEHARLDPARLVALLKRHAVDVLDCTPSQLRLLLDEGLATGPLSVVLVGGEALDPATWTRLGELDRIAFFNVYGPTECTVDATVIQVRAATTPTIGRPLANVSVHLLNSQRSPVTPGAAGEIYIGGAGVARGYLGQPGLTEDRFVRGLDDPTGERIYRTGDLARYLPDGRIEFLGRCDHQIKLRGFRIEAGEIESILLAHPQVAEAVVTVRDVTPAQVDQPPAAASQPHLVAYIVPREPTSDLKSELRLHLRRELPEYMVPSIFVTLHRMPLTRNGKVDRAALPEPSGLSTLGDQVPYEAPHDDVEQTIASIWQTVLGVPRVGIHHNFFDLGGHSLLMVQVYEKLCVAFGRRFPLVELFHQPTVSDLARYLGRSKDEAPSFHSVEERAQRQRQAMQRRQQRTRKDGGRR